MHVAVAGPAQVNRTARVTLFQLAPGHLPAPHPPGLGAREEVVAGEAVLTDGSAAQLAPLAGSRLGALISGDHPEIIKVLCA